jgi:hypothetical protein
MSGRHHHGETQWQHAREVYRLARLHWRRIPWDDVRHDQKLRKSFLRAALFHDIGKAMNRQAHDVAGFRWMYPRDPLAAFLLLRHMGRWGAPPDEQVNELTAVDGLGLLTPRNCYLADLLAGCDYTSAHLQKITDDFTDADLPSTVQTLTIPSFHGPVFG